MMKRFLILIVAAVLLSLSAKSQIQKGNLRNGLTYYLVKNNAKTMNYYMVQKTGASVEKGDEKGLAHFVEHVTVQCSGPNIPVSAEDFLRRNKIQSVASTYKYKIIYGMKGVDASNKILNDSCLYMVKDWIGGMNFKKDEIQKVRDVIVEEDRSGSRRVTRLESMINHTVYNKSNYAGVAVIGSMHVVKYKEIPAIKEFYHRWFNPNTTAVVIEGDINFEDCKKKVEKIFSDIKTSDKAQNFTIHDIPDNTEFQFQECVLGGGRENRVYAYNRIKHAPYGNKTEYLKNKFYGDLYSRLINLRLKRYTDNENAIFNKSSIVYDELPLGYKQLCINLSAKIGRESDGFRKIVAAHNSMLKYGLTKKEISELKGHYSTTWKTLDKEYSMFDVIQDNFLLGRPLYSKQDFNDVKEKICKAFNNSLYVKFCNDRLTFKNTFVCTTLARKTPQAPTQASAERILNDKNNTEFNPGETKTVLLKDPLQRKSTITGEKVVNGYHIWSFDNGLKFIFKKTNESNVNLYGISKGGLSVYEKEDLPNAESMAQVAEIHGTNNYSRHSLDRFKYLHNINMRFSIGEVSERIDARCLPESVDKMLQLLYMKITNPLITDLDQYEQRMLIGRIMMCKERQKDHQKEFDLNMFESNMREMEPWSEEFKDLLSNERMAELYNNKFNNASDWMYIMTGDVDPKKVKSLVEKYMSALPSNNQTEQIVERKPIIQDEKVYQEEIESGRRGDVGGTSTTYAFFNQSSAKELTCQKLLMTILKNRSEDELRYKRSGLYNVYLESDYWMTPQPTNTIEVNFGCKKENVIPYLDYIDSQFKDIAENGVSKKEMERALSIYKASSVNLMSSLNSCLNHYLVGKVTPDSDFLNYFEKLNEIDIREYASKFYNQCKVVRIISM